jgi:hypothetical protein
MYRLFLPTNQIQLNCENHIELFFPTDQIQLNFKTVMWIRIKLKGRIRIRIKVISWIRIRINLQMTAKM